MKVDIARLQELLEEYEQAVRSDNQFDMTAAWNDLVGEAVNALPALLQAWDVVEEAACGLCSKVSPVREAQITCIGYEPDRPEMWCLACKASAAIAKLEESDE